MRMTSQLRKGESHIEKPTLENQTTTRKAIAMAKHVPTCFSKISLPSCHWMCCCCGNRSLRTKAKRFKNSFMVLWKHGFSVYMASRNRCDNQDWYHVADFFVWNLHRFLSILVTLMDMKPQISWLAALHSQHQGIDCFIKSSSSSSSSSGSTVLSLSCLASSSSSLVILLP